MIIKSQKTVVCEQCKTEFTIHEYEGLEGAWYTDHGCDKTRQSALAALENSDEGTPDR